VVSFCMGIQTYAKVKKIYIGQVVILYLGDCLPAFCCASLQTGQIAK